MKESNCFSTGLNETTAARQESAFTLTELLVVLAMIVLLFVMLIPAGAKDRPASESARCLNNFRQLMTAMSMYTHENRDFFPPNPGDGNDSPGQNWCPGTAGAGQVEEFNPDILADSRYSLLASYVSSNAALFRCTCDTRVGVYSGSNTNKLGKRVPSARTISMNGAVGTVAAGNKPVDGPWLDGFHTHTRNHPWRTYGSVSDLVNPRPAGLFVLIEENPFSLNDADFAFSRSVPKWVDYPSTLHNLGGVVGFADTHAELHKWVTPTLRLAGAPPGTGIQPVAPNDPDWSWLGQRTTVLASD